MLIQTVTSFYHFSWFFVRIACQQIKMNQSAHHWDHRVSPQEALGRQVLSFHSRSPIWAGTPIKTSPLVSTVSPWSAIYHSQQGWVTVARVASMRWAPNIWSAGAAPPNLSGDPSLAPHWLFCWSRYSASVSLRSRAAELTGRSNVAASRVGIFQPSFLGWAAHSHAARIGTRSFSAAQRPCRNFQKPVARLICSLRKT